MILRAPIVILKILAWVLVIAAPTIGVWVASSLAAYMNGPIWLACLAGLLLFPIIPFAWDLWGTNRFLEKNEKREAAGKDPRKRILTFWDRMIVRTFMVNVAFLAALLATFPQAGFTALATRGDWFLETTNDPWADDVRPVLFSTAEGLSWLYELSMDNPYEQYKDDKPLPTPTADEFGDTRTRKDVDTKVPTPTPKPAQPDKPDAPDKPDVPKPDDKNPDGDGGSKIEIVRLDQDNPDTTPQPTQEQRKPGEAPMWPMKDELHPLVKKIPAAVQTDYASVATYIKEREPDPFLRVKAINDYVADRVAYDFVALNSGDFPPQDAKTVFETKMGVCAGYARLVEAMGKVTGDEIVYVVGVIRRQDGSIPGSGHAWNAVKIEGKWYLLDTTWNDGDFEDKPDRYSTNYLFTPPDVFGMDHLPDADEWQLRTDPLTRGEFMRQPMLPPEFYAKRLKLVSPERSQVEARGGSITITLENPAKQKVLGTIAPAKGGTKKRCQSRGLKEVKVTCEVSPGTHRLKLFAGPKSDTVFPFVAQFEVTRR